MKILVTGGGGRAAAPARTHKVRAQWASAMHGRMAGCYRQGWLHVRTMK